MRGNPLLQLILVTCLFAAAAWPVWQVTHPAPVALAQAAETPSPTTSTDAGVAVRVSFAPAPTDFRLSYLGKTVLAGRGPQADFSGEVHAAVPPEGADFALEANWPPAPAANASSPGLPTAVRVKFEFPDGHVTERSVWGAGGTPLVELLTITP